MKYISWKLIKSLLVMFGIIVTIMIVYETLVQLKKGVKNKIDKKVASIKTKGGVCPKCGGELIMREGKYGGFIGCSNYPKCRYTQKS